MKKIVDLLFNAFGLEVKKKQASDKLSYRKISYSQCGEDNIVGYIFNLRGINNPTYLDIGANHPYYLNNTASFYEKGIRGINVEANAELIKEFARLRSDDINLNFGISDKHENLDFYIMEDNTLSTFSKDEYEFMVISGKVLKEIKTVEVHTLDFILNKYSAGVFPDFLSIDAEGLDFAILKSIRFEKSSPKVICVEAAEYSPIGVGIRKSELIDFLISKGYFEYATTNLNAIMVKRDFWFI